MFTREAVVPPHSPRSLQGFAEDDCSRKGRRLACECTGPVDPCFWGNDQLGLVTPLQVVLLIMLYIYDILCPTLRQHLKLPGPPCITIILAWCLYLFSVRGGLQPSIPTGVLSKHRYILMDISFLRHELFSVNGVILAYNFRSSMGLGEYRQNEMTATRHLNKGSTR